MSVSPVPTGRPTLTAMVSTVDVADRPSDTTISPRSKMNTSVRRTTTLATLHQSTQLANGELVIVPSRASASFVPKLYEMVSDPKLDHLISWTFSGRSFVVKDVDAFENLVLPAYFKHNNFQSFQRQLNLYSFQRQTENLRLLGLPVSAIAASVNEDKDSVREPVYEWEFHNEFFIKGEEHLLLKIKRRPQRASSDTAVHNFNCACPECKTHHDSLKRTLPPDWPTSQSTSHCKQHDDKGDDQEYLSAQMLQQQQQQQRPSPRQQSPNPRHDQEIMDRLSRLEANEYAWTQERMQMIATIEFLQEEVGLLRSTMDQIMDQRRHWQQQQQQQQQCQPGQSYQSSIQYVAQMTPILPPPRPPTTITSYTLVPRQDSSHSVLPGNSHLEC